MGLRTISVTVTRKIEYDITVDVETPEELKEEVLKYFKSGSPEKESEWANATVSEADAPDDGDEELTIEELTVFQKAAQEALDILDF